MFGRIEAPDARDMEHPMRAAVPKRVVLPEYRYWVTGETLNQGMTGTCVAHAWVGWLLASPIRTRTGPNPFQLYRECVLVDEWGGNDGEATAADGALQFGTSVRAGAKALTARGHVKEYIWGFDVETVKQYVLLRGPVVIGSDWFTGFMSPDSRGFIKLSGVIEGGHAYLCSGYSQRLKAFRCLNSWGESFGQRGRFWMPEAVMAELLASGAEAASAIEKKV
jgi:hypothetical protein